MGSVIKRATRFRLRDLLWLMTVCGLVAAIWVSWSRNMWLEQETGRIRAAEQWGPKLLDILQVYKDYIGEEVRFERNSKGQLKAVTKNGDRMHWVYPNGGPVERIVTDENGQTTRTRLRNY
jgi:hypothetical protein